MHGEEDTAAGYWMMMGWGRALAVAAAIAVAAYVAVTVAPSQASLRLQALGGSCGSFGDARGLLLSTPALHAPPASAKMNLYANLTFDVASAEGCTVAARYAPAESSLPPLWLSSDCSATSFALLRLRPSTFYDVALVVSVDGATTIEWRGAFETQGTGWAAFDEDRGARRQRASKYNSTHNRTKEFDGLLAIDAEGYVVWYYHAWSLEAWDFLPDNGVVLVARDDGTKLDGAKTYRDDGRTYNGNSQLQEISPLGDIRKQFISACAGSPLNYNMVSHECRVDRATAKRAARRRGGRLDVVYDLFDLAKPVAGSATPFVTKNWDDVDMWCSGNATMEGWTLSSTLNASDDGVGDGGIWYGFEDDDQKFYDPHSALQLPNGDLLVVDDGDDRPGCATANTSGCFSRAIAYELDAAARREVRWQFEWPSALDVDFKTDDPTTSSAAPRRPSPTATTSSRQEEETHVEEKSSLYINRRTSWNISCMRPYE
ncbi:hypothetical protein JL722_1972 [Aureococcus anophagefferens]|nr:hypothetical protein JL722_1972 [Aureococcus anophagefferens]